LIKSNPSCVGQEKFGELWSAIKKVIGSDVDIAHSAYSNAFKFGPCDFAMGKFQLAKLISHVRLTAPGSLTLRSAPYF